MPYILKGHVPYVKKVVEPVVVSAPKSKRHDLKHPQMDKAILAGTPTSLIMAEFGVTNSSVQARKFKMRRAGVLI